MSQSASQQARPKLDIRSLATPKPPRRFLTQAVTPNLAATPRPALHPHYAATPNSALTPQPHLDATPSFYSHRSLPSPPFTPIDPPVPPPPSMHTQPLHSTPLINPSHSAFHDDAKAVTGNQLHSQESFGQEKRKFCDSDTYLPSPAYVPLSKPLVLPIPCLKADSSSASGDGESSPDVEDMDQGAHSLDGSDSLPSPAYVPISRFVSKPSVPPAEAVPPTPWQDETGVKVREESKVESVFELSLDSLVSDYPEGGEDGLIVEPGEQNGLPGGGQEDLGAAFCLGDDGGKVHHLSAYHQKPCMTRFTTPTTNPRLTGPGQVETMRMTNHLPDQQGGDLERSAYINYSKGKGGWTTSSEEKEAATRYRMDWTAAPVQPADTAWSSSSQLSRNTSSSPGHAKPGWSSTIQMDRADSTSLYNRGAAFSTPGPAATAWSSSSRDLDRAAYSNTEPPLTDWSSSSRDLDRAANTNTGQPHVTGWSSSGELDRAANLNTGQPPGTAWSSSRELDSRAAYSTTEHAVTAWSSSRDLDTAAYSSSQLAAQLPGTSDDWDRRGDILPDSQDSGPRTQAPPRLSPSTTPTHHQPPPPALNTLSQKVSHLGKARSLFSPSPSPRSSSAKSNQLEKSVDREKGEEMEQEEEKVMSICYAGGNLGAALFNTYTGKLELLRDIPDLSPGYEMLTSLVYQVEPDIILVSARQDQTLLECLKCLCGNPASETSAATLDTDGDERSRDGGGGRCISLVMRPGMEFGLSSCLRRVKRMEVPGKPSTCEQEQLVKLSAFVDFSCNSLVRAAGALLKYLDKNYRTGLDMETPMVLFISSLVLEQILTMDQSAFTALQVFSASAQLSGSKAGSWNRRREGLSILNILNRCGSVVGSRFMRRMLRCPSANLEVIILRQQAITFFTSSGNVEFVQALCGSIKQIKNFHRLMNKLVGNTMTVSDWQAMYRTLSGLVQLAQLGENCKVEVPILREVMHKVTDSVYSLRSVVEQVIDFQASLASGNLSVKPGVDQELDEKRRLHNALPDLLNVVAQEESKNLPPYMKVCTVCYLPQVGYLIAIPYKKELEDQGVDFRSIPGFEFVFESNGAMHYRNRRTLALDQTMGDVVLEITKVEMGILSRLTEAVLRNRNSMEEAVSLCGQLDCLLALAMVSKENNWTRPVMIDSGDLVIKEGRHPLQELSVTDFIPNSSWLGGEGGRVHLLTGPNSSGKSVYMKQVGLIVYLAHLGCCVPAREARIPITDRILTRIQTVESISLGMSSFLCDINQLSTALSTSSPRSLLLVDEFGKGTAPSDGAALLAATVLELLSLDQSSPLCILSSHFHLVPPLLGSHSVLRYFQLETKVTTMGLVYMFKLVVGVSGTSQARHVALKAGVQEDLVNRADRVLEGLVKGQPAGLEESLLSLENIHQIVSCYLDVDLGKEEEVDIFIEKLEELVM